MKAIAFPLLFLAACAAQKDLHRTPASVPYSSWEEYVQREVLNARNLDRWYPDSQFLKLPWRKSNEVAYDGSVPDPSELRIKAVSCGDKTLWPTHPQQTTKNYLHGIYASYDHTKLPADSHACNRASTNRRSCLSATWAYVFIMSDTYQDSCGNYFRGYWMVNYLKKDDNMGTLLSKGRTVYQTPGAQFKGDYDTAQTYGVEPREFLFLAELESGDMAKIRRDSEAALRAGFRKRGLAFEPR
jgi:hypothetical protein